MPTLCTYANFETAFEFAGVAGGGGMMLVITTTLIIVGGVIIKRRRASKRPGECLLQCDSGDYVEFLLNFFSCLMYS